MSRANLIIVISTVIVLSVLGRINFLWANQNFSPGAGNEIECISDIDYIIIDTFKLYDKESDVKNVTYYLWDYKDKYDAVRAESTTFDNLLAGGKEDQAYPLDRYLADLIVGHLAEFGALDQAKVLVKGSEEHKNLARSGELGSDVNSVSIRFDFGQQSATIEGRRYLMGATDVEATYSCGTDHETALRKIFTPEPFYIDIERHDRSSFEQTASIMAFKVSEYLSYLYMSGN
ncbi:MULTISPECIES: hypothetical protein [unclassified Mameliella]|uniref:hypothetical protein n=1 Tax=unclassified Mameliella TaxID=2630630 RepID=UPI00273E15D3|nr:MULTISPECIES: hypothetical protein [unclassified Mameliella]